MKRRAPRPLAAALERFTASLEPATVLGGVQAVWAASVGAAAPHAASVHAAPTPHVVPHAPQFRESSTILVSHRLCAASTQLAYPAAHGYGPTNL